MTKRIIIVHGWRANPNVDFVPWLGKELQDAGFKVDMPQMPHANKPIIEEWIGRLSDLIGIPDKNTYLIGRSVGSQAIIRYLSSLDGDATVGGALLVAPFTNICAGSLDSNGEEALGPWITTPSDWEEARRHCSRFIAIVSTNDPYIEIDNSKVFEERLGARIRAVKNAGHFRDIDGYREFHIAFDEVIGMVKEDL